MNETNTTRTIAQQNDAFRARLQLPTFGTPVVRGHSVMTCGVVSLGAVAQIEIAALVRDFANFTPDNDPHREHDFGALDYNGTRVFWKIDYHAPDMEHGSEDPADPAKTMRVLTIMLASEY
jgi:hypothetical protein